MSTGIKNSFMSFCQGFGELAPLASVGLYHGGDGAGTRWHWLQELTQMMEISICN